MKPATLKIKCESIALKEAIKEMLERFAMVGRIEFEDEKVIDECDFLCDIERDELKQKLEEKWKS